MSADSTAYQEDPSHGWVSIQEIKNVFIETLRELDAYVMPKGGPVANRDAVLKCFDTMQYKLYRRAQSNLESMFPTFKPVKASLQNTEQQAATQAAHEQRLDHMRRSRV